MSNQIGNLIADSLKLAVGYAEKLLTGVPAEQFARFAAPGGQTVESNHPAFIYGHLSLYGPRIVGQLGGDVSALQPSERFSELFAAKAQCQDDPDGSIYPSMEEITDKFFSGYHVALATLPHVDDEQFAQRNPQEGAARERFPTLGSMHAFYCSGHMMIHLGQMSAWRRMQGLGPA